MIKTRPVVPEQDESFLLEAYISTRMQEVALWGWSDEDKLAFLQMQFQMQKQSYQLQFPNQVHHVILFEEAEVGRIITSRTPDSWVLVDIALLPDFRNRGIGSKLLEDLLLDASRSQLPVRLSVLSDNPARRLYERHGFQTIQIKGPYLMMECPPKLV